VALELPSMPTQFDLAALFDNGDDVEETTMKVKDDDDDDDSRKVSLGR